MDAQLTTTTDTRLVGIDVQQLLIAAVDKGLPVETMERLLAMRSTIMAEEAKRSFFDNLAEFQRSCPVIVKDKEVLNKDGRTVRYRYAPLDSIIRQIGPLLADRGFSYTFTTEHEEAKVSVTCHARHRDGHVEDSTFVSNIDPAAFMNLAQKYGSALTFGKRYAFLAAFGIMTGEDDDDSQSTNDSKQQETAREKLANLRAKQRAEEVAKMPDTPLVHGEIVADNAEMGVLTDFLTGIADMTESGELDAAVEQYREFASPQCRKTAKEAISARAKVLGLVWDKNSNCFVGGER